MEILVAAKDFRSGKFLGRDRSGHQPCHQNREYEAFHSALVPLGLQLEATPDLACPTWIFPGRLYAMVTSKTAGRRNASSFSI
jgi:hypothetical protein